MPNFALLPLLLLVGAACICIADAFCASFLDAADPHRADDSAGYLDDC